MTDSASILSVGSNGFEAFFDRLTAAGLAVVGAASVESFADSSVDFALLSSASDACALAVPKWSAVMSVAASAADTLARIERVMRRLRLFLVADNAKANVFPSFLTVVAIGKSQPRLAGVFPTRAADDAQSTRLGADGIFHGIRTARVCIDPVSIVDPLGNISADIEEPQRVASIGSDR